MGHVAKILAHVITYSIVALILFFLGFFVALTLAVYLNTILESAYLGYVIICGVMLLELIRFDLSTSKHHNTFHH